MSDLVSIIIPVYNPGEALRKCLESVISQSYRHIEIIIINDGSTDGSLPMCKEFAERDSRINLLSQPNAGVSAARNRGIAAATGEFICFVDADDYVDCDYVSSMLEAAKNTAADVVIQGLKQIKDGWILKSETFEKKLLDVGNLSDALFKKIFYYCGPYCKLFKATIIKGQSILFPTDLAYGEDAVFYHSYLSHCTTIEMIPNTSYNYLVANQGALSSKTLPPDKFWQNQSNRRGAYKRLRRVFGLPQILSSEEERCKLTGIAGMLSAIYNSQSSDAQVFLFLEQMLSDSDFDMSTLKPASLKSRVTLALVKSNNRFTRFLLKKIYG